MHSTTPPQESLFFIHSERYAAASASAFLSGMHVAVEKIASLSKFSILMLTGPIDLVYAVTVIPISFNILEAIAPAATRPAVSLAEERPPPR